MQATRYVTTPIYYVNDKPHIGHAYTTLAADVLARYWRLRGYDSFFLTGTDEHGLKVQETAQANGKTPREWTDGLVVHFKEMWQKLHIAYDGFIRTTDPDHERCVQQLFQRYLDQDDLYLGSYEGWYCKFCETYFTAAEVQDGLCPNAECRRPVRKVSEPAYFFRTSGYAQRLEKYIVDHPEFIQPESRRNEVLSFIRGGLKDNCVSRLSVEWGVPVPGDESQVVYVWFDALINYLSALGYPEGDLFKRYWPPTVQLMAKDILTRFHATLWPAMLMAADLPLPRTLFAHGFWTAEGEKMSKSKGNFVSPVEVAHELAEKTGCQEEFAIDAVRYFLLREVPFGADADFSRQQLEARYNAELCNDLGNLLNRTVSMTAKFLGGKIPGPEAVDEAIQARLSELLPAVDDAFERVDFTGALEQVMGFVNELNKYLDTEEPWRLNREGDKSGVQRVLGTTLRGTALATCLLAPFLPVAADEILRQLGTRLEAMSYDQLQQLATVPVGEQVSAPTPVFPRIEKTHQVRAKQPKKAVEKQVKPVEKAPASELVSIEEFKRLQLKTAKILAAERLENTEKLLKLQIDLGEPEPRQLVAGLAKHYTPEELVGRTIIVIANLKPARLRGVESQGMLLAATTPDGSAVRLLCVDGDVPPGSTVS